MMHCSSLSFLCLAPQCVCVCCLQLAASSSPLRSSSSVNEEQKSCKKNFSKFKYECVFFATMPWGNQWRRIGCNASEGDGFKQTSQRLFIARQQGDDRSTIDTDASADDAADDADDDLVNDLEIERHPCFRNGFQFFFWVLSVATTKTRRWTSTCSTCRPTT